MLKAPFFLLPVLKKTKPLYQFSNPCLLRVLLLVFLSVAFQAQAQSAGNGGRGSYGDINEDDVARKYALKIGVSVDSLEFLEIYHVMDKWSEFVATNPEKIGQNSDAVFGQFMYYLAFKTKIPADVPQLFKDRKTYLFKNLKYLRTGDLIFYGKTEGEPDKIAFYLQNDYTVYPDAKGVLQFQPYPDLQKKFYLTAAKIDRDE